MGARTARWPSTSGGNTSRRIGRACSSRSKPDDPGVESDLGASSETSGLGGPPRGQSEATVDARATESAGP